MAISEYSRKNINFKPDLKQEQYLLSLSSGERSQFIREAINEKINKDKDQSDAEIIGIIINKDKK